MRPASVASSGTIAVALHDVEAASYERCALIRDWLDDLGIAKVTLLVIPASDLHAFSDRRPEMVDWLAERVRHGDTVAQHGFQHRQVRRSTSPTRQAYARWQGGSGAEFVGLDDAETKRAVEAGRRVLRLAGIQPRGFVAPAYAYTGALQRVLAASFEWWASLRSLRYDHGRRTTRAQALALGPSTGLRRLAAPTTIRAGAWMAGPLLRLDLHPADLDQPSHVGAVEAVLRRARHRTAVTYDELALPPG